MTLITEDQLKLISIGKPTKAQSANMKSFITSVNQFGAGFGMNKLYNLASFIGQVMVESGEFKYDREIWGPTPQQKKYEGRKDLGNTQKGDGSKFRGFGPIQLTGRNNVTKFYKWCLENHKYYGAPPPPDFTKNPSLIATDPWEGLSALWYWGFGNPEGKSLNKYSEDNNQLMVTKRINGGTTHYDKRLEYQGRAALVLLGYGVTKEEIRKFQLKNQPAAGSADGVVGDRTLAALHIAMKGKLPVTEIKTEKVKVPIQVPVPVKVESLDKPWYKDVEGAKEVVTTLGVPSILSFFTDISTDKLLILVGVLAAGSLVWYLSRRSKARAQNIEVSRINSITSDQLYGP